MGDPATPGIFRAYGKVRETVSSGSNCFTESSTSWWMRTSNKVFIRQGQDWAAGSVLFLGPIEAHLVANGAYKVSARILDSKYGSIFMRWIDEKLFCGRGCWMSLTK